MTVHRLSPFLSPLIVLAGLAIAAPARADEPRSVFSYSAQGFGIGALTGLSAGYLIARSGDWESSDWRTIAYGVGIGALAGGTLGLGLGIADLASSRPGRGYVVLEDMLYGTAFGAAAGAIAGGLAALGTKDAEHIVFGAAIGAFCGAGLGLALGLVEGNRMGAARSASADAPGARWTLTISAAAASDRSLVWMPALAGRY